MLATTRTAAWIVVGLCLLWIDAPAPVRAYSAAEAYPVPAEAGGGEGRWFSGSPAEGYGCSVCHSNAPQGPHFPLYVAGLPIQGYTLDATREVVLSWPEFGARWYQLRPPGMLPGPDAPTPAMGLVAEFIAESGKASGTIEIDVENAGPQEQCEVTRPNLKPRLGAKVFQVRPGVEARRIRPDSTGVVRCTSRQLGQRCIVALTSCGAQQIRLRWTAPDRPQGPIWFAAGFVATEALSGGFEGDSVHEIRVPMVQADAAGGDYQRVLSSGCAVGGDRPPLDAYHGVVGLALLWGLRRRRRGL